ncbi:MAG TPA: PEGA domain-containing protein [Candidatus Sulfotelmatobacter sp.]
MPTKLGQFEIQSELSKSPTGIVYKANDADSGQTIALKAIQLAAFGDQSSAVEQALLQEVQSAKVLSNQNLCRVTNSSIIDGQFCAIMEYVQGNSIATMLARKEGFSIWDLLDIGRQLGNGLDDATSHQMIHHSLEPAKIMCGWDGTVKILSYGVSGVGNFVQHAGGLSSILNYMPPEQLRGEATDLRSNLFSLGAIFYEMVTERKAFDGSDSESIRQNILESTPTAPIRVNAKVHPLLSDLIMKALAKDPAQRYQTGRALLDDLENCKESRPAAKKAAAPTASTVAPTSVRAAVQSKFVGSANHASPSAPVREVAVPVASRPAAAKPSHVATPKSVAAAAGVGSSTTSDATSTAPSQPESFMPAAIEQPDVETFEPAPASPKIAVDPLMAGSAPASGGTSFSEIAELPPLKEVYIAPEPAPEPPPVEPPKFRSSSPRRSERIADKPKIQPRAVAAKAVKEIKGVPPRLMLYAVAGAAVLILAIIAGVTYYIRSQNEEDSGSTRQPVPAVTQPAPRAEQPVPQPEAAAPADSTADAQPTEVPDATPEPVGRVSRSNSRGARRKAAAPVALPGQLTIDSTPQGAQVSLDGSTDPSWTTPLALTNIQAGKHSITISKSGYTSDTRSVEVASGAKATTIIHLSQLSATLIVKSDPSGASIYIDTKDAGTKTPAQISVPKGQHLVLVRKEGYLDETMNMQFVLGQTFNFSPTLRALGNVENMKTVGKMSKLFGKKGQADQGTISIHTQPKGAQIAINQHMLDKSVPVDVMLDPGNYVIDVTASGYHPIHKVVTVEKGSKVLVDDVMQQE